MRALAVTAVLIVLAIAAGAHAQVPDVTGPIEAELDDVEASAIVVPLKGPVSIPLTGRIGCELVEPPLTTTTAALSVTSIPASLSWVIAPTELFFVNDVGTCPADAPPYVIDGMTTLVVAANEQAPAFEPLRLQVSMTVTKSNEAAEPRVYGPFTNNVTVVPGYHNLFQVQPDTKRATALSNETAVFALEVTSLSNGETAFVASTKDVSEGLEIRIEPQSLVLAPGAVGTMRVDVTLALDADAGPPRSFKLDVASASTHPMGGQGATQTIGFDVQFNDADGGVLGAPGPAPLIAVLALLGVALVARAFRRNG